MEDPESWKDRGLRGRGDKGEVRGKEEVEVRTIGRNGRFCAHKACTAARREEGDKVGGWVGRGTRGGM